jgi:hypothetical protein
VGIEQSYWLFEGDHCGEIEEKGRRQRRAEERREVDKDDEHEVPFLINRKRASLECEGVYPELNGSC